MAKTPTVKEMQAALAGRPYKDAPTQTIDDWKWHPMEHIKAQLAERRELPTHVEKYAEFMQEMNAKAQAGTLTPRDLIKAHTITQSSIGRGGLSHSTATSRDMKLPNTGGEVRPEGAFAEWLGSPMGQKYLDAAERGEVHQPAIADLMAKFAPFGKQNVQGEAMKYAAQTLPQRSASANYAVTGPKQEYRDFARKIRGIAGAKSGFIGSLLGRGDQPTLDARQLNLHSLSHPTKVPESMMDRQRGLGGTEAVDRLTARQEALGYKIPKELKPFAQHLIHHDVWDQMGGTKTTHEDLIKAMRGYADGGDVAAMKREMDVKRFAKGGAQTWPANLPPAPVPSNQEMTAIVDRIARQQLGEHVTKPGETTNLAGRSIKEAKRIKQTQYELKPTREVRPTPVYAAKTGDVNVVLPGDQTISDQQLVSLNDKPIGSDQEGGSRYGEGKLHLPKAKRPFWASGPGPAQGFQNRVTELAQITGQEPSVIAHHLAMARAGNNFALHFADANLKAIGNSEIKPEHKETFNTVMQQGFPDRDKRGNPIQVTFPHWPGVENPTLAYRAMQADPEMRKWFNDRMKTSNLTKALGFPNGLDVEYAISEPELRNMEINMTGHAVGKMVPGAKLVPGADHNTYSHKILGTSLGRAPELAPMELSFLDATHYIKPKLSSPAAYTRTMSLSAPHQVVDDRYLNMMNDYYTKLRAVRGYAEGGKAEPDLDEMRLANTLRKPKKKALDIRSVGVDEAPDMAVKTYVSPGLGKATTLPIGGVDFAPMMPGQQLAPGAGTPGQPQPPQQGAPGGAPPSGPPAGPPGSEVPMGGPAPGVAPVGQSPQTPQSNILAMTRQGQALRALTPVLPPPMKKAAGGAVGSRNFQDGGEVADLPEVRATVKDKNLQRKVPEMEAAAKALQEGVINRKEYDRVVKKHKPVRPYDFVPQPATNEDALRALHDDKKPTWRGAEQWPAGRKVGLRLDIPAYEDHGVWVNSIHDEEGKGTDKRKTSYGPVSSVKNATFDASPNKAVRVATGEQNKSPFARIKGELHHMTEDEAVKHIQENLHHPDYAQVGMDPRRHGYFYDRKTLKPVTHSAHVVQIGPLVLAHKPTYGKRETYKAGGVAHMAGGSKEANLRAMREEILQQKGQYGARRLDRAADEIRNLSKLYTPQALREAFTGDNAQAIMSMNPAHFENYAKPLEYQTHKMDPATIASRKAYDAREGTHQLKRAIPTGDYIQHLVDIAQSGGFEDVPYLKIDKEGANDRAMLNELYAKYGAVRPITPHLVGHEGRHRNRALAAMGQRKGLVRLFPRAELREPLPRRSQEEYIEALRKQVPGNMVTPEPLGEHRDEYIRRSAIALPDFYNKGGSVEQMSAELREKGRQKFLAPSAVKDVMYHGTNKDITSFDPAKSHRHTAWFTGDPEHANKFVAGGRRNMGAKATKGSAVYPVHLSIKNPLNLTKFPPGTLLTMPELLAHAGLPNDQDALRSIAAQALSSRYAGVGSHIADPVSHIAEGYSRPARVNDMLDNPALINAFKAAGYDGLQQVEDNAKTYATFHPTQVKSATGNRGTYDPANPDITKKSGGKVTLPASKEQMERELKRASHFKQKV